MGKAIDCGSNCGWKWGRVKECKRIRQCACTCGPLKAINPNLYEACKTQCNSNDKPDSLQDFKCNYLGGEVLFNQYGLSECGFQVEDSVQYQVKEMNEQAEQVATAPSRQLTKYILIAMIGLVAVGFIAIIKSRLNG